MTPSLGTAHSHEVQGNTISFHREFDAPRELVFFAWTVQQHLEMWWGPAGFRTTTTSFDFREGGEWDYTMHGPDGKDWPHILTFTRIVPNERIEHRLVGKGDDDPHGFATVVEFIDLGNQRTRLEMTLTFTDAEAVRAVTENNGAIVGHRESMQRLEDLLPALADRRRSSELGVLTLTRDFDAPIDLVWQCWTEADKLAQWFGPEGFSIPHCAVEAVVGGRWHLAMRDDASGQDHWCGGVYSVVERPTKLVFTDYFANPEGEMVSTASIGMPDFPDRNTVTVTFEALGPQKTRMVVTNDTPLEVAQKYYADLGWGSSFVKLRRLVEQ